MSNKYKQGDRVPTEVLARRLDELGRVVPKGRDAVAREFTMSIPAEMDRGADFVLTDSAARLLELEAENERLRKWQREAAEILPLPSDYWTAEEGEDFRLRRDALLKALAAGSK